MTTFKILNVSRTQENDNIPIETDWEQCVICQNVSSEQLQNPKNSKNNDSFRSYQSFAENLLHLYKLDNKPYHLRLLNRLDEDGEDVVKTLFSRNAKWHKSCRLLYNNQVLKRAEKRKLDCNNNSEQIKHTRSVSSLVVEKTDSKCFFCGETDNTNELHQASTFEIDKRVRECASLLEDTELIGKLSVGDMVALEAKYHSKCLVGLYNRARTVISEKPVNDSEQRVSGLVFAELVMYIEEARNNDQTIPIFKLADLATMYSSRLQQFGVNLEKRIHSTRLKDRLLAQFPDMHAHTKGRDVLLAFDKDIGRALFQASETNADSDAIHLARAAHIVRQEMFKENQSSSLRTYKDGCQEESVPQLLLALVNMILEGPSIKNQSEESTTQASLSIAQLLKFNSVRHKRISKENSSFTKHHSDLETPVPTYLGLMVHAQTRKRGLVDKLHSLGLCISYDKVLTISTELGNRVCQQFEEDNVVCPLNLRFKLFTTAAVDNIDHNPSSTSAKESFHGTGISLFQHPESEDEGIKRELLMADRIDTSSKTLKHLPHCYTEVPSVTSNIKDVNIPRMNALLLTETTLNAHLDEEYTWLKQTKEVLENSPSSETLNFTWAAYHAQNQTSKDIVITTSALLPLFHESAHSVAMIKHSMDVVKEAIHHLNEGQVPIITFDQPLFALAKQIQWKWPEAYGEDLMVVMFGGLHIEMAILKTIGDWLSGSGWSQALVQAGIAKSGTADSFLKASHVARTRRAHEVTAAALYNLQYQAYEKYTETALCNGEVPKGFAPWCATNSKLHPMFHYWNTVLELELFMLSFVRSLREANFVLYIESLTMLTPWFFALDHTNYARWIPVHLRDMHELTRRHPEVEKAFHSGHFTVQKTKRVFSAMPLDQGHEQNNACIKGDGGAVGLTDNPGALRRWMVAGPEVAQLIKEFEVEALHDKKDTKTQHHEQTQSIQQSSVKDVSSLIATIRELVNPFEDDSKELVVLDTRELATTSAIKSVYTAHEIGKEQFNKFTKERLIDRSTPFHNIISRNKLPLFVTTSPRATSTSKTQLMSMKSDIDLFSRLYIGCQTRDGNLDEFFCHENQACPPSLSESGFLRLGKKCDLLKCLADGIEAKSEAPPATCVILDGAVIVQMLKLGTTRTFDEYAKMVFVPHVLSKLHKASRLDLVWDKYIPNSLKDTARTKRGEGAKRRVIGTASLPANWQSFLHVNTNKDELFKFLSQALMQEYVHEGENELYVTENDHVHSIPEQEDLSGLSPCSHEEADTRLLLHAAHALRHGHEKILIRTVDTDVVVLSVMVCSAIFQQNTELWIAFGTGKHFRYLAAHEMSSYLGPEKSRALPMFHALTGCDTVSSFARHGKKSAWTAWNVVPELTDALLTLASAPARIPDSTFTIIEKFVIKMYDKGSKDTQINSARKTLFMKNNSLPGIPPTRAALEQHIKRATYQGGHVWGQTLIAQPELPSPTDWGWTKSIEGLYKPFWTNLPEAAKSCSELVSCKCKKGCKSRCTCKKASLKCSPMCLCQGLC